MPTYDEAYYGQPPYRYPTGGYEPMPRYRMATQRPARKVIWGAVTTFVVTTTTWLLRDYAGIDVPGVVEAAATALLSLAVMYFVPPAPRDAVVRRDQGEA